jgi:hypothetical protein
MEVVVREGDLCLRDDLVLTLKHVDEQTSFKLSEEEEAPALTFQDRETIGGNRLDHPSWTAYKHYVHKTEKELEAFTNYFEVHGGLQLQARMTLKEYKLPMHKALSVKLSLTPDFYRFTNVWPASMGLAQVLLAIYNAHGETFTKKKLCHIQCGLGFEGLLATHFGPATVYFADSSAQAVSFTKANAALNGMSVVKRKVRMASRRSSVVSRGEGKTPTSPRGGKKIVPGSSRSSISRGAGMRRSSIAGASSPHNIRRGSSARRGSVPNADMSRVPTIKRGLKKPTKTQDLGHFAAPLAVDASHAALTDEGQNSPLRRVQSSPAQQQERKRERGWKPFNTVSFDSSLDESLGEASLGEVTQNIQLRRKTMPEYLLSGIIKGAKKRRKKRNQDGTQAIVEQQSIEEPESWPTGFDLVFGADLLPGGRGFSFSNATMAPLGVLLKRILKKSGTAILAFPGKNMKMVQKLRLIFEPLGLNVVYHRLFKHYALPQKVFLHESDPDKNVEYHIAFVEVTHLESERTTKVISTPTSAAEPNMARRPSITFATANVEEKIATVKPIREVLREGGGLEEEKGLKESSKSRGGGKVQHIWDKLQDSMEDTDKWMAEQKLAEP